jgi:hypothetical protein
MQLSLSGLVRYPNGLADRRDEVVDGPAFEGSCHQLAGSQSQGIHDGLVDDLEVLNLNR